MCNHQWTVKFKFRLGKQRFLPGQGIKNLKGAHYKAPFKFLAPRRPWFTNHASNKFNKLRTDVPSKPLLNEALETEKTDVVNKHQHIIHTAISWEKMLEAGEVESLSEIAKKEGLTRARVTQIMNLLKLSPEWKNFLLGLMDPKEIRRYSERRLRNYHIGRYAAPPIKEKLC